MMGALDCRVKRAHYTDRPSLGPEVDRVHTRLRRSIQEPIREGLDWQETWKGPDRGLIWCWERGRQYRIEDPARAARAEKGELVMDAWKGGVERKLRTDKKYGTLRYLATWQGMRGEDLDIDLEGETTIVCTRTGQPVVFSARLPEDEESAGARASGG